MMYHKSYTEFMENADDLFEAVTLADDAVTVDTPHGKAVIINEAEWNICRQALQMLITEGQ